MNNIDWKCKIEELESVLSNTYNGIVIINNKRRIVYVNNNAELILGINENQVKGKLVNEVIKDCKLSLILNSGKSRFGIIEKVNDKTKVLNNCLPIMNNGEVVGAVAVIEQIKEMEKFHFLERKLSSLIKKYISAIDLSYDGFMVTDNLGKILLINQSFASLIEKKTEQIIGYTISDLLANGIIDKTVSYSDLKKGHAVTYIQVLNNKKVMLVTSVPIMNKHTKKIDKIVSNYRNFDELVYINDIIKKEPMEKIKIVHKVDEKVEEEVGYDQNIIAQSPVIKNILNLVSIVAKVDTTVLILGESGVGKEVIANQIYKQSFRNDKPFIKVNCGAIPENLMESELFGYEEGAFTGAKKGGKPGFFELANHGTIMLDEIGDLPLYMQVKLLRALQEKVITRVGGTKSLNIDVRVIAATNVEIEQKVKERKFRSDLFYRINVVTVSIPPLRERKEDIHPLANYFLSKFNEKYEKQKSFHPKMLDNLYEYNWPGNIRELENLIERLVILSTSDMINVDTLSSNILNYQSLGHEDTEFDEEYNLIKSLYEQYQSTRKVAEIVGCHQTTIVRKLKKYNIKKKMMQR